MSAPPIGEVLRNDSALTRHSAVQATRMRQLVEQHNAYERAAHTNTVATTREHFEEMAKLSGELSRACSAWVIRLDEILAERAG